MFFILRSSGISTKGGPRSQERPSQQNPLTLTSPDFKHNEMIPTKFTCEGENINPSLEFSNVPEQALSLVLIVHDSDAPVPGGWTHWVLFNIDPNQRIEVGEIPNGAKEGITSFGKTGYGGPCPPSGTHHYEFKLYALDSKLALDESANKADVEHAMEGHVLTETILMGLYQKKNI